MGDKISARKAMVEAGVPILPGTGLLETDEQALAAVEEIGLPVIIKASAGGGGRGMKIVKDRERLLAQLEMARAEALAGFGSSDVYLERYVEAPRHIEVQVVADGSGGVAILGERECSIQRRHQKLVEEAPSIALTDEEREKLLAICEKAMRAINYSNVGTLEFLLRARPLLLHGDEHAHPGRAHRDRDGHRARPRARADQAGRGRAAVADASPAASGRAATPSSAASTPRIR